MKRITPTLTLLLALAQFCHAQAYKNEKVIYLDAAGQKTREKNAAMLEQQIKFSDTVYEINLYHVDGPMFRSSHTSDPDGNMPNGEYKTYDGTGRMDTSGFYYAGKRLGFWYVYSNSRITKELLYDQGKLLWAKDTLQLKREGDPADSLLAKDTSGDKTFAKVEIESAFPGGSQAWLNYLQKNMHYPDKALMHNIKGQVIIGFVVDKEGHIPIERAYVDRSVEYTLDQEALRIIFASSGWTPAIQKGKAVSSYKKQPIVYMF